VTTQNVVVVTGLSGAGKTTAVEALEDLGFYCVDNLPIPVVEATLSALAALGIARVGLGIDVRLGAFLDLAPKVIDAIKSSLALKVSILFLDAADDVLIRRFGSTRRPHPLSTVSTPGHEREAMAVLDGIMIERVRLASLRSRASSVVDTSGLSIHDLRRTVIGLFDSEQSTRPKLSTRVVSFGFKYGLPLDADLVLDVRFLSNPYFVETLRDLTGLDLPVRDHVLGNSEGQLLLSRILEYLNFCLPRFEQEGKSHLTIAIGCTGGRHRSVAVATAIAQELHQLPHRPVDLIHRDIRRELAHEDRASQIGLQFERIGIGRGHQE
jgi:RNase adapter protein RapZ